MKNLSIKIARADGLGGFAAYLAGSAQAHGTNAIELDENQALGLLDVEATFDDSCVEQEDGSPVSRTTEEKKRQLIECLMHEFGHVLEDFLGTEFEEGWIESVTTSYASA